MSFSDPHSTVSLEQGQIKHIDFKIAVDFSLCTLDITAHYTLNKATNGSLFLDTRDLTIKRIQTDGASLDWKKDQDDPILGQRLHIKGLKNTSQFTIELTTSPDASALQWATPAQTAGKEYPLLYTQCQAIHARSVFPCQDSPSVRFTFNAEMVVANPLVAVMGAEKTGMAEEGGKTRYSFAMNQPIPSYLFALAVGNLEFREFGPRSGVYAEPEIIEESAWEFAENEEKLTVAESLLGPYRWDRYDILVLPPSFPYGGMENPRLTFLTASYLLGDRSSTNIISHELAHAWTGNLITNATWEDFWLNEGWTTYAEYRITEALEGVETYRLLRKVLLVELLTDVERLGADSERTSLKSNQKGLNPDDSFTIIPYAKGAAFLIALENVVGRKKFDAFLQKYISTYSFQSLTTEGFLTFLEQELPKAVAQVDVNAWIFTPGIPESAKEFESALYNQVEDALKAYTNGPRPSAEEIKGWNARQKFIFMRSLPETISLEDCAYFEALFDIKETKNTTTRNAFYLIAVRSGYQDALQRIEDHVCKIGAMYSLSLLFRTMVATDWSKEYARPFFEKARDGYHPITAKIIAGILDEAGL